jgi:hypothetical protein
MVCLPIPPLPRARDVLARAVKPDYSDSYRSFPFYMRFGLRLDLNPWPRLFCLQNIQRLSILGKPDPGALESKS